MSSIDAEYGAWLAELRGAAALEPTQRSALFERSKRIKIASPDEADALATVLAETTDGAALDPLVVEPLDALARELTSAARPWHFSATALEHWRRAYQTFGSQSRVAARVLRLLAAEGSPAALALFAESIVAAPPTTPAELLVAFAPLLRRKPLATEALYPRLFDALEHPSVAVIVLDVANYLKRERLVAEHPGKARGQQLTILLRSLVARLTTLEEAPEKYAATTEQLTKLVGESVALVVALCDALAWIGDPAAIKELRSAMELRHRRIRVEAAAALARLGEADGLDHLVELAAQPLVRTRVLHYLEELDEIERVPEEHRTALARAAGELTAWLAEPTRFGIPPTLIEPVDERQMYWPGFDEPQDCFLFRYEFRVGEHMLAGVAMAGPVVHALMVDLQDLPPIEIYAAYAGWYAEHPEIRERGIDEMSPVDLVRWRQASSALENAGYEDLVLVKSGRFFHQEHFVATARREGRPGVVVFDQEEIYWQPTSASRRPLGPTEVYYIRKGRALLQAFNQAE